MGRPIAAEVDDQHAFFQNVLPFYTDDRWLHGCPEFPQNQQLEDFDRLFEAAAVLVSRNLGSCFWFNECSLQFSEEVAALNTGGIEICI